MGTKNPCFLWSNVIKFTLRYCVKNKKEIRRVWLTKQDFSTFFHRVDFKKISNVGASIARPERSDMGYADFLRLIFVPRFQRT